MPALTVTIIARDEADRIGDAIRSVAFADEVLVLDSGSRDDTSAIARGLGARVIETDWPGYVAQKNRAVEAASNDWVFGLDADERVSDELGRELRAWRSGGAPAAAGFQVGRLTWWMGAPIRHGAWWPDRRVRLFDRRRGCWNGHDPHDYVRVQGSIGALHGLLHHHPYRDLREHLSTIERYSAIHAQGARSRGERARWVDLLVRPPAYLLKALFWKRGVMDGARGLCLAFLGAAAVSLKWTRLLLEEGAGGETESRPRAERSVTALDRVDR